MSDLARTLRESIEEAGYEPYPYSGRGMFGKECVGFTVSHSNQYEAVAAISVILSENQEDAERVFKKANSDEMGRDIVIYFPGIPFGE